MDLVFRQIDPRSPIPLVRADRRPAAGGDCDGEMSPGIALPSVRNLASAIRVNPATVVQAYRELEQAGVARAAGTGTFVRELPESSGNRIGGARRCGLVRELMQQAATLAVALEDLEHAWRTEFKERS